MLKKKIIGGALGFAAAFVMSAAAFAQHGPGGPGGHRGGPHGPGGGLLSHFSQVLNLTDAQKAQIKQLEEGFRESTKPLHEQLRNAGPGDPLTAVASGTFDESAVRAAAQARANAQVEREVAHARMMHEMYNVLTAEQKSQLAAERQQREQRRQERRARRGGQQQQQWQ